MKWVDIVGGYKIPLSNEEYNLYEKLDSDTSYHKLTEREQELATLLTSKGALFRSVTDDDILYKKNKYMEVKRYD